MTDPTSPPADDPQQLAEERRVALTQFARVSATALQGAMQFAAQAEQSLATSVAALMEAGLTVDDVAVRLGLRREYVEELLQGGRMTFRFI